MAALKPQMHGLFLCRSLHDLGKGVRCRAYLVSQPFFHSMQQEASHESFIEEQTFPQQHADASTLEGSQGHYRSQHGVISQQGGFSNKRKNQQPLHQGQAPHVGKFSRSWHRVSPQEPSQQGGAVSCSQGPNTRPWQRGALLPSTQEQAVQAPYVHTPSSLGCASAQPTIAMERTVCPSFLQTKSSFSKMWLQLEGTIENRERMLLGMKAELEKALLEVKVWKDDTLKEKEELEARKAGVRDDMDMISKQNGKVKIAREGLEQISTDLSVQVAELNHRLQQAQEQQRVLKVLESLKDHREASNDNSFMFKNLHDCEVKLSTMEKELLGSKQTTELLEKAALKWTSDLGSFEAGYGPNDLAKSSSSTTSSMLQETAENFSKRRMDAKATGFKGEPETLAHSAALKQPKLEVVS